MKLQSSDDESAAEEEAEVIRLQKEYAKSLSMEDFGLEDSSQDESDRELTLEVRDTYQLVPLIVVRSSDLSLWWKFPYFNYLSFQNGIMNRNQILFIIQEISVKGKRKKQSPVEKEVADGMDTVYEEVKKDLNTLPREKVMDVLFR